MKTRKVKLATLVHPEKNVRMHSEGQLRELAKSVEMFGQTRPVVVDEGNVILVGNGLVDAMRSLEKTDVSILTVTGLSDSMKKKLMLTDNRMFTLGKDNPEVQIEFLKEIIGEDLDFDIPGYERDILEALILTQSQITAQVQEYGANFELPENTGQGELPGGLSGAKQITCPNCGEIIWVE